MIRSIAWRWGPVVLWMAGLFWGSALLERPPTPGMRGLSWDDKFQHTAAYAILALLAWRALGPGGNRWLRAATALVIAAGYGAFDECHQFFVPGRECGFSDWSCDATGAALAAIIATVVAGLRAGHSGRRDGAAPLRCTGGGSLGRERKRGEDLRNQG